MAAYELMIKTNRYLIQGGKLTAAQKENITRGLLAVQQRAGNTKTVSKQYVSRLFHPAI